MDDKFYCCHCLEKAPVCNTIFELRTHYKDSHHNWNDVCKTCENRFRNPKDLEFHLLTVHGREKKSAVFFCIHCKKSFKFSFGLVTHYKRLHPACVFKCSKCLNWFEDEANMSMHKETHSRNNAMGSVKDLSGTYDLVKESSCL